MRLIRMIEVVKITGRSRTSIWRDIKEGSFPVPVNIGGRAIAFVEDEVQDWIQCRIDERDKQAPL